MEARLHRDARCSLVFIHVLLVHDKVIISLLKCIS